MNRNRSKSPKRGIEEESVISTFKLYNEEARNALLQCLDGYDGDLNKPSDISRDGSAGSVIGIRGRATISSSSSSSENEEEDGNKSESSSSSESSGSSPSLSNVEEEEEDNDKGTAPSNEDNNGKEETKPKNAKKRKPKRSKKTKNKKDMTLSLGKPPSILLPLPSQENKEDKKKAIEIPTSLLPAPNTSWDVPSVCAQCIELSKDLSGSEGGEKKTVVVLLLQSGRFAGGVFQGDKCLIHRTSVRYTVRKGQGGSQSAADSHKGKAKSIGSQLRRAGEVNLRQDVSETLDAWSHYVEKAAIIFMSVPKTMQKGFYDSTEVIKRGDERIRKVPLSVKRPTYECVCGVYEIMMSCILRYMTKEEWRTSNDAGGSNVEEGVKRAVDGALQSRAGNVVENDEDLDEKAPAAKPAYAPMTPLHEAAAASDLPTLLKLIESLSIAEEEDENNDHALDMINVRAGEKEMTPLHYAALATTNLSPSTAATATAQTLSAEKATAAASCVSALLLQGHANPCIVDSHNRPPYYIAANDKIRDAFRLARSSLGEDYCSWDDVAKVGPALSTQDLQDKKAKAAEKKRQKRARQKAKKNKEKAEQAELDKQQQKEEEEKKKAEDAKRIRDGLQPKKKGVDNVCDFCQTAVKGKRRSQMFQRLDYVYCSTDCVKKHQRELMAAAATARLGGGAR